ncbi:MAG: hypothetical protein RR088_00085 [Clostridia bacterium]
MNIDENFLDDILKEYASNSDLPKTSDEDVDSILASLNDTPKTSTPSVFPKKETMQEDFSKKSHSHKHSKKDRYAEYEQEDDFIEEQDEEKLSRRDRKLLQKQLLQEEENEQEEKLSRKERKLLQKKQKEEQFLQEENDDEEEEQEEKLSRRERKLLQKQQQEQLLQEEEQEEKLTRKERKLLQEEESYNQQKDLQKNSNESKSKKSRVRPTYIEAPVVAAPSIPKTPTDEIRKELDSIVHDDTIDQISSLINAKIKEEKPKKLSWFDKEQNPIKAEPETVAPLEVKEVFEPKNTEVNIITAQEPLEIKEQVTFSTTQGIKEVNDDISANVSEDFSEIINKFSDIEELETDPNLELSDMPDSLHVKNTTNTRLDAFFKGYTDEDLSKLTIDETAFTDARSHKDFTDSFSSYRDFSNSMTSGATFTGILGKFLNEKEDTEEPLPEYVNHTMPEIDDFNSYDDTETVQSDLKHLKQSAFFRSIFATVFTALLIYLNIGILSPAILPEFIRPEISFFGFGATSVILLLGLIFAGAGTFFESIMKLFSLRPTGDSLASVAVILSVAQGVYIACSPQSNNATPLVVSAIAAIAFTFSIYTKLMQIHTVSRGFNIISDKGDKYTLVDIKSSELPVELKDNEKDLAAVSKTAFAENYLENSFCPNPSYKINRILTLVAIIGIVITAIVGFAFHPIPETSAIYNALVAACCASCISACFLNSSTFILPSFIQNFKAARKGGTVVGYDSVIKAKEVLGIITPDNQLLSGDASRISGMKMLAKSEIYDVVTKLASIYNSIGGTLSGTFLKIINNKTGLLQEVTDIEVTENEGIHAVIENLNVFVGNTKYLISSGIIMPDVDYEKKFAKGTKKVIQVAFDGELRGVFVIEYKASENEYECIDMIDSLGLSVITYSEDFNINADVIKTALEAGNTDIMEYGPTTASKFKEVLKKKDRSKASIISNGGLIGILSAIKAARGISRSFKILSVIKCINVVLGLVLCSIMFYSGSPLPFNQLLLYQSIWTVLGIALSIF